MKNLLFYSEEVRTIAALKLLVLLNFFDLLSTMILFEQSVISEGNPVMAYFLLTDPSLFSLMKLILVYTGVVILYVNRFVRVASYTSLAVTSLYLLIVIKHFWIYWVLGVVRAST